MNTAMPNATSSSNLLQLQQGKGDALLNLYVHDYLIKHKLYSASSALAREADLSPTAKVPIDAPQSLLYEWWSVFWDVLSERASQAVRPASSKTNDASMYTLGTGAGPRASHLAASQHTSTSAQSDLKRQRRKSVTGRGRANSPRSGSTEGRGTQEKVSQGTNARQASSGADATSGSKAGLDGAPLASDSMNVASPGSSSPTIPIGFGANNFVAAGHRTPQQTLVIRAMVSLGWAARSPDSLSPEERSQLQREMARLAPMDDAMRRAIGIQRQGTEPDISALQAAAKAQQDAKHATSTVKRPRQVSFSIDQQAADGLPSNQAGPSNGPKQDALDSQRSGPSQQQQGQTLQSAPSQAGLTSSSTADMPSIGTQAEQARDFEQQQALARSLQQQSRTMMNRSAPRPPPPQNSQTSDGPPWQFGDLLGIPQGLYASGHPQGHAAKSAMMSKSDSALERANADAQSQLSAQIKSLQQQSPSGARAVGVEAQIQQLRRLHGRLGQQHMSRSPPLPDTPPRLDVSVNSGHMHTPGSAGSGATTQTVLHPSVRHTDSSPLVPFYDSQSADATGTLSGWTNNDAYGTYGDTAWTGHTAQLAQLDFQTEPNALSNHQASQAFASSGLFHNQDAFQGGLGPLLASSQDPKSSAFHRLNSSPNHAMH